jgi:glycopeptide antibiotics resistance protein
MSRSRVKRLVIALLGVVYLGVLYQLLLHPTASVPGHTRPLNLVPFQTIRTYFVDNPAPLRQRMYQFIGNLFVFAPISVFCALTSRRLTILPILLVSAVLSSTVETLQYVLWTWRSADIDDVLCNTCGAVLVYVVVAFALRWRRKSFTTANVNHNMRVAGGEIRDPLMRGAAGPHS